MQTTTTLMDALARHPLGGVASADYIWETLSGDVSPDQLISDGETLEAAAAKYADWFSQEYPEYETTDHDTGDTVTRSVTPQDVCYLAAWIVRYVEQQTSTVNGE